MQRLRLTFGRDERLKYVSHLDTMRLWQRAFRRADIPLAYSQGYSPHPRMSTAAPLAVGMTGDCEIMDVYLELTIDFSAFLQAVRPQLPPGMRVTAAEEAPLPAPSLPSLLRYADYELGLSVALPRPEVESRIASLLSASSLPRERLRDGRSKRYDLRPLIDGLKVAGSSADPPTLWMRLQANPTASGRPEEVVGALGIEAPPRSIRRVGLILAKGY